MKAKKKHFKSLAVGASATAVLTGTGAGIGYTTGALWGGNTPGDNAQEASQMGAFAGGALGATAGAIGTAAAMNVNKAGEVGKALGTFALNTAEVAGAGIIGTAEVAGAGIIGGVNMALPIAAYGVGKYARIGAGMAVGIERTLLKRPTPHKRAPAVKKARASSNLKENVASPVTREKIQKQFSREKTNTKGLTKEKSNLLDTKLNVLGKTALIGSALFGGSRQALHDFNTNRMGQRDGQMTRATPQTPSYANNAGATGDLVFAMNRNRRG